MKFGSLIFLEADEVERLHRAVVDEAGGSHGTRDRGLLESALAAPRTTLFGAPAHTTLATMAAALTHAVVKNHALIDGNKRSALVSMLVFLELNGVRLSPLPVEEWLDRFEGLADGRVTRDAFGAAVAAAMEGDVPIDAD
jgi:death-on-curing protein